MLEQSIEERGELRKNVTSPKGTTEAALKLLMAEEGLMGDAVRAAERRSQELAN